MKKIAGSKKCIREVIGMDDRLVMLFGIPILAFFIPILFFNASLSEMGLVRYLPKAGVAMIYTLTYWLSVRQIIIYFRRKFPLYRQLYQRLAYNIMVIVPVYILLHTLLDLLLNKSELAKYMPMENDISSWNYNVVSLLLILLIATIYESVWLNMKWKESIVAKEKLEKEYAQSQLESLKSQVNPHFLFNSLNTLTYLIPEDSEKAVKFVQKLSKVYRYILELKDKKLTSLKEELNFLDSYIFLLKERFGENLNVKIDVDPALHNQHLIPLSLQLLFENAIKHNIISKDKPLEVCLWVDADRLLVRNNLQRKAQEMPSTRVGLENIRHRYTFYTNEEMEVIETSEYFLVALPLLKDPVAV